jgi:hypothetical protein
MINKLFYALIALCVVIIPHCSTAPLAGGSSQQGNGMVMGMVEESDGSVAANAIVRLRRADYVSTLPSLNKASSLIGADAVTDDSGRFEISGIDPGSYRIEVGNSLTRTAVIFACSLGVGTTADLGTGTLRPFAAIEGRIDTVISAEAHLYMQVQGLERLAIIDAAGRCIINDLPSGAFTVRVATNSDTIVAITHVVLDPGERTTVVLMSGWRFSKRLCLNTTASGAGVRENVIGFPLLVRLDSSNFDFSQARDSGQDLRFSKSDGSSLPYEIEQWDASSRQAAIWVRIDTVRGNDTTQRIAMHWGNASAISQSNGQAVFTTANGFAGVWHLGGDVHDATVNGNNGVSVNTVDDKGCIGGCRYFDGESHIQVLNNATLEPRSFTLSCWVKRYGAQKEWAKFISKGRYMPNSYSLEIRNADTATINGIDSSRYNGIDKAGFVVLKNDTSNQSEFLETAGPIADSTWCFLAGSFNEVTGEGVLYLNGERIASFIDIAPIDYALSPEDNLLFGADYVVDSSNIPFLPYHAAFMGELDEIRVDAVVRSAAWVRLSFKNQLTRGDVAVFE